MSSGGDKKENVTNIQQSGPPDWSVPYFQSAIQRAGQLASQPYRPYSGGRVAGLTGDQRQAMNQVSYLANSPGSNAVDNANNYLGGVIGGTRGINKYSGQNPHLDQMIGSA